MRDEGRLSKRHVIISAGDMEKYSYCPLSWKLRKDADINIKPLRNGKKKHNKMGRDIDDIKKAEVIGKESETSILWFAAIATILAIMGITMYPPLESKQAEMISLITMSIAMIWLLAASFFLYLSVTTKNGSQMKNNQIMLVFSMVSIIIGIYSVTYLISDILLTSIIEVFAIVWLLAAIYFLRNKILIDRMTKELRLRHKIKVGKVEYVGEKSGSELLISDKYGLSGRPDYILKVDGAYIPIEAKFGRSPRGPHFSHIMQIAAYCILIEDTYGSSPPYGILKYEKKEFKIDFTEKLREDAIGISDKIRDALSGGEVHRNHNRPGKCLYCSRREVCKERLA